jgi:hypothetical protein
LEKVREGGTSLAAYLTKPSRKAPAFRRGDIRRDGDFRNGSLIRQHKAV